MPSLRVFGRNWTIASDDFVFPEITEATIRFLWSGSKYFPSKIEFKVKSLTYILGS